MILAAAPRVYPCVSSLSLFDAAFILRPQSVRAFAGHSQFANIKVCNQYAAVVIHCPADTYPKLSSAQESCRRREAFQTELQVHSGAFSSTRARKLCPHSSTTSLPLLRLFPRDFPTAAPTPALLRQMVRACSYEVGGDVTNPRLASLIERAKAASVPKVTRFLMALSAPLSQSRF